MTIYVTALQNTRARLIESESHTDDSAIADVIVAAYKARGLIVLRRTEDQPKFTEV